MHSTPHTPELRASPLTATWSQRPAEMGMLQNCSARAFDTLLTTIRCKRPIFESKTRVMPFKATGILFSEALALVAAAWTINATHVIESGTAKGQSTEILARVLGPSVQITTIDNDARYSLYERTKERLQQWASVRCLKGDSFAIFPQLLPTLPKHSRALVFVDGPKYEQGLALALYALSHPCVALVALHDTASLWDWKFHLKLRRHPLTLLMTDIAQFRAEFAVLDGERNEVEALRREANESHWPVGRLSRIQKDGMGLWIGVNLSKPVARFLCSSGVSAEVCHSERAWSAVGHRLSRAH
mmetsp:Transcript_4349/g.10644  ORF Transcript_4349/g.10644 Transcript_4349/m.10644 type:complete len:301 (-) Transcript_4349:70-972(-)